MMIKGLLRLNLKVFYFIDVPLNKITLDNNGEKEEYIFFQAGILLYVFISNFNQ